MGFPAAVRSDDRRGAPQPVDCARCGASVQVMKFSPQHTSVQWTAVAAGCCAEFRARAAEGTGSALIAACGALRASIERAVTAGALVVAAPSYGSAYPGGDPPPPGAYPGGDPRTPERTDDNARR